MLSEQNKAVIATQEEQNQKLTVMVEELQSSNKYLKTELQKFIEFHQQREQELLEKELLKKKRRQAKLKPETDPLILEHFELFMSYLLYGFRLYKCAKPISLLYYVYYRNTFF